MDAAHCDAVLADLLMLAAVQKDTKVWTRFGGIQVSASGSLSGFARWFGGEGRADNVEALKSRVTDGFAIVDACVAGEDIARAMQSPPNRAAYEAILWNRQRLALFQGALAGASAGIAMLGRTYGHDARASVVLAIEARNIILGLERAEAALARLPKAIVNLGPDLPLVVDAGTGSARQSAD
jgi:hypothetical protein